LTPRAGAKYEGEVIRAALLALALLGCREPAPTARSVPDASRARERLRALRDETVVERAKVLSTAANLASYRSSLRKYAREAEAIGLSRLIPEEPRTGELRRQAARALSSAGLRLASFRAEPRPIPRRTLPETVPEGPRFPLTPDDIRGVVEVRLEIGGPSPRLAGVLRALRALPRLVFPIRARETPESLHVLAEAYFFHADLRVPTPIPRERSAEAALAAAGIDPAAFGDDPEAQGWLDETAADYREMRAHAEAYREALTIQSDLRRFGKRMEFARERSRAVAARTPAQVLAPRGASP
jgi:hypothetical protein